MDSDSDIEVYNADEVEPLAVPLDLVEAPKDMGATGVSSNAEVSSTDLEIAETLAHMSQDEKQGAPPDPQRPVAPGPTKRSQSPVYWEHVALCSM